MEKMKIPLINNPRMVKIGSTYVGINCPVFFIAEIGINHNGSIDVAKELILEAKKAGAHAVKFQKRNNKDVFTSLALNKKYESPHAYGNTYGEHREALEFEFEEYKQLFLYAKSLDILLFASVWDLSSVNFMKQFDVDAYKIASADMNYFELIEQIALTNKPILVSTGMATQSQIKGAMKFTRGLTKKFIFMHCTSAYPSDDNDINLKFMKKIRRWSQGNPFGYSGHEKDWIPTLLATLNGATVIERHLTLNKTLKGSDHSASLVPYEFAELVYTVGRLGNILGNGSKHELGNKVIESKRKLGKSIYTNKSIYPGQKILRDDIVIKSPGGGLDPDKLGSVLNKKAKYELESEHQISLNDLEK
jgi:sialic acid synthase SpsE